MCRPKFVQQAIKLSHFLDCLGSMGLGIPHIGIRAIDRSRLQVQHGVVAAVVDFRGGPVTSKNDSLLLPKNCQKAQGSSVPRWKSSRRGGEAAKAVSMPHSRPSCVATITHWNSGRRGLRRKKPRR